MAHPGQHLGALVDVAADAVAHAQKGGGGLAHFGGARRFQLERADALAEAVGGLGQAAYRADLVAQKDDGDGQQDQRGADHPHDEDIGRRAGDPLDRRQEAQHAVDQLDPDLDLFAVAGGVDAVGPGQALAQGLVEHRIKNAVGDRGLVRRVGQDLAAQISRLDLHVALQLGRGGRRQGHLRRAALDVDDHRNVAGQAEGQAAGHGVPVALVKHIGGDHLQQDHRGDDDRQSATEQGIGQQAFEHGGGGALVSSFGLVLVGRAG